MSKTHRGGAIREGLRGISVLVVDEDDERLESFIDEMAPYGAEIYTTSDVSRLGEIVREKDFDYLFFSASSISELDIINSILRDTPKRARLILLADVKLLEELDEDDLSTLHDIYLKPVNPMRIALNISSSYRSSDVSTSLTPVESYVKQLKPYMIFRSPQMKRIMMTLPRISASEQPVLITGETGTGKELAARAIHFLSKRREGNFVAVNCGAIPDTLIEGELFGHEKGAFTGALRTHKGKFEIANRGTLFLDEIGDMPLSLQVKLLRVLEEGEIYRIGAERPVKIDVRVIAATRRELHKAVQEGLFRDDLYYRLNVLKVHLPPLRERTEDIPLLAIHFFHRALSELGLSPPHPELSNGSIDMLERLPWRGNIRELRNLMTRVATFFAPRKRPVLPADILHHLDEFSIQYLMEHQDIPHHKEGIFIPIGTPLEKAEEIIIKETLRFTRGNKSRAARILNIGIRTIRRKLNKYSNRPQ